MNFYEQKKSYLSLTNVTIKLTEREVLVYFFFYSDRTYKNAVAFKMTGVLFQFVG